MLQRALPHAIVAGQVRVIENASVDPVPASGAVWSTVADMSKWVQWLLDGGRIGGRTATGLRGEVTVSYGTPGLHIQYGSTFIGILEQWHYNTFRATWKAAWSRPWSRSNWTKTVNPTRWR